jgi:transcriptional regulator with XRE-family HTH domain
MLSCEHLSSLFFYNGFTSLTLGWLSTHILIEKCTQGKSSGAFLVFQGAFPKKQGAFCGESGAFLKNRVHFGKAGCISRCRGLLWPFYNSHTLVLRKTISKWENGKCMPDYSVIEALCQALSITLPELMDGEDAAEDSVRVYDDTQMLDLLRRTQELEKQKGVLYGLILIVLGIACSALSATTGGSEVQDFVSGLLMGLSIVEMLAGIAVIGKKLLRG